MYDSSLPVRRLLNCLIGLINHFLPWGEKIWKIPVIRFASDPDMESVVLKYQSAMRAEQSAWLGNFNKGDPYFQAASQVVKDLESHYGTKLEKYLAPYEGINLRDISQHEDHRVAVVEYRAKAARRE